MCIQARIRGRDGAITAFSALMLIFLLGMVAFAIDIGYIVVTQTELQNAADSSALAGARELMQPYVLYQLPGQSADEKDAILASAMSAAEATAREYAGYNAAGNVNSLSLLAADVDFGFTNASGNYTPYSEVELFPNTIKIKLRRDASANGPLRLFVAPVLGTSTTALDATASATIYGGVMNEASAATNGILPAAYDERHWADFLQTGTDPGGNKTHAGDGTPELQILPLPNRDKGNFGWLSLDGAHASANELDAWIHNGISPTDVQTLTDLDLIPLSEHNTTLWDWIGTTGMKGSDFMDVNDYTGKIYILPLFKAKNDGSSGEYAAGEGEGSNYYYNITQFVGIRIMPVDNENRQVVVQPAAVVIPSSLLQLTVPAGSQSYFMTTFAPPRLTH